MTLVLSVIGSESIWTVADRRLTSGPGVVRDDARKLMFLEAGNDVAILAYAGLGATARGTEPADWMSSVLRGRNWPIEQSLAALAEALRRELPPHLARLPVPDGPSHTVLVSAFVNEEPRMYTIDLALSPDRARSAFRHVRRVVSTEGQPCRTPRFGIFGSAIAILARDRAWRRPLLRLVSAYDSQRITAGPSTSANRNAVMAAPAARTEM